MSKANDIDHIITTYRPRGLTAEEWALCAAPVADAVRATGSRTEPSVRRYLVALCAYLAGPSAWDRNTPPVWRDLLTVAHINAAREDLAFGTASTRKNRCDSLTSVARAIGVVPRTTANPVILVLPAPQEPVFSFPAPCRAVTDGDCTSGAVLPQTQVAAVVEGYRPRKLDTGRWDLARPAVLRMSRRRVFETVSDLRVDLSQLAGLLRDEHLWDGAGQPDLHSMLTRAHIEEHLRRTGLKTSYSVSARRGALLRWARAAGSVLPSRSLRTGATPVDPVLAYAAVRDISVRDAAAAYAEARPELSRPVNLDPVIRAIAALQATARSQQPYTVWAASTLRVLAEVTHQDGAPMTSRRQANSAAQPVSQAGKTAKKPSRKAQLAEAKAARERAAKNAADAQPTTGAVAVQLVLPDPASVSTEIRAAVEGYVPLLQRRAAWETNRDLAERLVYAYGPSSARNARNVASYLAAYIHWVAQRPGHDPSVPLVGQSVVVPHLFEEYFAASTWSDSSLTSSRSLLRRINDRTRPHAAPVKLAHPKVAPPYTGAEADQFVRLAWQQPSPATRRRLAFIVALGLGAGLDATDLRRVRRSHLRRLKVDGAWLWVVAVPGDGARERVVPIRTDLYPLLERAITAHDSDEELSDEELVVENPTDQVSIVSRVVTQARTVDTHSRVSLRLSRLRHTWLVNVMCAPVSLVDVMAAAGLRSGRSVSELLEHCSPADPIVVAEVLAGRAATTGDAS